MGKEISEDNIETLFQFVKESHEIKNLEELNKKFGELAHGFGYDTFICTELVGSHKHAKPSTLFGKWSDEWDRRYFNKQYFRYDDCLRHLKDTRHSFTWDEVKKGQNSTPIGLRIMEEAKDFKARDGVLIPLRSYDGRMSVVTMMGQEVDKSGDALVSLEIAAIYFSEVGARLLSDNEEVGLSDELTNRQVEILKWLALGKRTHDVAEILGISIKTIDRHLEDARARLNVLTTHQLLVSAVINGDIA